mmetsp:Transcript_6581/g.9655  ORF Transcript_6581/g.9655 Transcript_6581/m.9655 type:complete len:984 (-) Transcript_6581:270-3221(-)
MRIPAVAVFCFLTQRTSKAFSMLPSRTGFTGGRANQSRYAQGRRSASLAAITRTCRVPTTGFGFSAGGSFSALTTRGGSTTALNSVVADATAEKKDTPVEFFRKDYAPLPYLVSKIHMDFYIENGKTTVTSKMFIKSNPKVGDYEAQDLVLDGDETCVKLLSLKFDDADGGESYDLVEGKDYELAPGKLILKADTLSTFAKKSDAIMLSTVVEIVPEKNTALSGMYKSGTMYCSQCEAMGFRRITYYPDRPDNMAIYERVRIEAAKDEYPNLLSNGNRVESGDLGERHYAVWSDPFPKPSYLFCIVAGNLSSIKDSYTTTSGREVKLEIFSEPDNVNKLDYAMESLKKSMKWDEDVYGLEYDLDLFNIVAVNDFNMGAMENKGLNVFNTAYVLASPESATDTDYELVEGVIGHEYFHNWTGNRVTCKDWFQLTLKEGLTVFRDQEFSGDMNSKPVKRIEDVKSLRGRQFNEDSSPMAHPIRPDSYISMDNFYTATVYSKGAEVIRMYHTLLGKEGFRKGMDLYFERHDGQAVSCDDFRMAMADANGKDLDQFALWYSTPGTPTLTYSTNYDKDGTYSLTLKQSSEASEPLHIPVAVGLLDKETGEEVVPTTILELKEMEQTFTFDNLKGDVVPSLLRDFSAPVKLIAEEENKDAIAFLAARDTDGFNKWEAGQQLYTSLIFQTLDNAASEQTLEMVLEAFGRTLQDSKETTDYSISAYALSLPNESTLAEQMEIIQPTSIRRARGTVKKQIARKFKAELELRYQELTESMKGKPFSVNAVSIGRRRLRNVCLEYLCSINETDEEKYQAADLATSHFKNATGMTDKMAALNALASMDGVGAAARDAAIEQFYQDANGDALLLNKWFSVQALSHLDDVLERVKKLTQHPDFTLSNPNRCRSLLGAFAMNLAAYHTPEGYKFLADQLEKLDPINPQISSRLTGNLIQWRRHDEERGASMKAQLERLVNMDGISKDMYEVVSRGLKD